MEFIRTSAIIIDEMLMLFRRNYPELTGIERRRANSMLAALSFRYLNSIPTHLRFFAREFPITCVEKTPLFNRDDEIIRILIATGEELSGQAVRNLDFMYITERLFEPLM